MAMSYGDDNDQGVDEDDDMLLSEPSSSTRDDHVAYGSNLEPHPDPNEEDYEGMIYVGRLDDEEEDLEGDDDDEEESSIERQEQNQRRRLGFDIDNTVRYIFGTAFDYETEHRDNIDDWELMHEIFGPHHPDFPHHDHHHARRPHKTREEVLQERRHKKASDIGMPKPFGYVDTHELDGGVTPPKAVAVDPFFLDEAPVTNKQFGKFVRATHYETEAEKFGWSFVLISFLPSSQKEQMHEEELERDPEATQWVAMEGAYWRRPEGPNSSYKFREHHPVVHVSHRDALEYCSWVGKRLPGEREYEAAARFGHHSSKNRTMYPWGNDEDWNVAKEFVNLWGSGEFPYENLAEDGWRGTSPVKHYPPNDGGFFDTTGNVWEWMRGGKHKNRIVRGGSYVDSLDGSFNHAATLGARSTVHATTTSGNIGFRCAKAPKRRTEYHWVRHDEAIHGSLAIEDQFGHADTVPQRGWEDQFKWHDEEEDDLLFGEDSSMRKKKVIKPRELLSTEL